MNKLKYETFFRIYKDHQHEHRYEAYLVNQIDTLIRPLIGDSDDFNLDSLERGVSLRDFTEPPREFEETFKEKFWDILA